MTSLTYIIKSAGKMDRLIEDLLAFSRSGRQELKKVPVAISSRVSDVLEELKQENSQWKGEIKTSPLPHIKADPNLIREVWINLLSNAIKYSGNEEKPVVEIGSTIDPTNTVYYVKDNGVGFDMQYASKLFNVFQRLHTDSEFAGTGIGLAIVKRIVERHGGKVWVTAKVDEGLHSIFHCQLKINFFLLRQMCHRFHSLHINANTAWKRQSSK